MVAHVRADRHRCPECDAGLGGAPLRCNHCPWHLITRAEWEQLSPFQQGYMRYMQATWPTSERAHVKNPYQADTQTWMEFTHGERRAMLDTQDNEE